LNSLYVCEGNDTLSCFRDRLCNLYFLTHNACNDGGHCDWQVRVISLSIVINQIFSQYLNVSELCLRKRPVKILEGVGHFSVLIRQQGHVQSWGSLCSVSRQKGKNFRRLCSCRSLTADDRTDRQADLPISFWAYR
jgi:hypothetical protein